MADVVLRPSFPAQEIERQRASGWRSSSAARDPVAGRLAVDRAALCTAPSIPYGYHGDRHRSAVKAMTRDDMVAFWKQNFVPNNAALVVVGRHLDARAARAGGEDVRRLAGGTPARPRLDLPATTAARSCRGQAGSAADAGARGGTRRPALVARLPADAGDEHRARRHVLEPHQHESARGERLHLRRQLAVHVPPERRAVPGGERRAHGRDRAGDHRDLQGDRRACSTSR